MLWLFYGLPLVTKDGTLIYIINVVGLALETIYLTIFFIYVPNDLRCKVLKILGEELLFVAAMVTGVIVGVHSLPKRAKIVGALCVIFGICRYAYPLLIMKLVIQTKSIEYMPFFLSLAGFLNGISNGLGALLGLSQLILYFCYYGSTPKKGSMTSTRTDVEMAAVDDAQTGTKVESNLEHRTCATLSLSQTSAAVLAL